MIQQEVTKRGMKAVYKNGLEEILPCWFEEVEEVSEEEVAACKAKYGEDSVYD